MSAAMLAIAVLIFTASIALAFGVIWLLHRFGSRLGIWWRLGVSVPIAIIAWFPLGLGAAMAAGFMLEWLGPSMGHVKHCCGADGIVIMLFTAWMPLIAICSLSLLPWLLQERAS